MSNEKSKDTLTRAGERLNIRREIKKLQASEAGLRQLYERAFGKADASQNRSIMESGPEWLASYVMVLALSTELDGESRRILGWVYHALANIDGADFRTQFIQTRRGPKKSDSMKAMNKVHRDVIIYLFVEKLTEMTGSRESAVAEARSMLQCARSSVFAAMKNGQKYASIAESGEFPEINETLISLIEKLNL